MSTVLPFDIIALIIDIVGENEDTNLLKELTLVSHSFHQICSKHLFATIELYDGDPDFNIASTKRGFVKLLTSRPDVAKYIRKLTYKVEYYSGYHSNPTHPSLNTDDHLLLPILPNLLQTTSRLNCLTIAGSTLDWNTLDSSLRSAFLHLMHLRTINHIALLLIDNFPLSSLTLSVNLLRLDMTYLSPLQEDGSPEIVVQSDMMPKIRELHISESALLTTKLLHAKRQDGRPAFNFMDLRRLSMSFTRFEDEQNIRYLLQNAGLLEKLHLSIDRGRSLVGLLSPSARTLKVLDLTVFLYDNTFPVSLALAGLCEELEAMAGHNMLEALSLEARVLRSDRTEAFVGSVMQSVEKVLVKPGWSALRQVSFKVAIAYCMQTSVELCEALQSLPDKYLTHLSNLESVAFNFSAFPAHL